MAKSLNVTLILRQQLLLRAPGVSQGSELKLTTLKFILTLFLAASSSVLTVRFFFFLIKNGKTRMYLCQLPASHVHVSPPNPSLRGWAVDYLWSRADTPHY